MIARPVQTAVAGRKDGGHGSHSIRDRVDPLRRRQAHRRPCCPVIDRLEEALRGSRVYRTGLRAIESEQSHARHLKARAECGPRATAVPRAKCRIAAERRLPRVDNWKIARGCHSRDVRTPCGIHGNALDIVISRAADSCRIREGARGVELHNEHLFARLGGSDRARRRKIPGVGVSGDICVADVVDGHIPRLVVAGATKVRRVDERVAGRIELRDERIAGPFFLRLEAISDREVGRDRHASHDHVAGRVHGHAVPMVLIDTAKVRGIAQDRIDDQRQPAIVCADAEAHRAAAPDDVAAGDNAACAVVVLIDRGSTLKEIPVVCGNDEIAIRTEARTRRTVERERDRIGARSGRDDEVVLELLLTAVIDDIDAAIHASVLDFTIASDTGHPAPAIAANQVIRNARQRATNARPRVGVAADERHRQRPRCARLRPE